MVGDFMTDFCQLSQNNSTISLTLEKQVVKNIPKSDHDVLIDWVVTEDRIIDTQR